MKDPYAILGVASDAKQKDIKEAYRRLARAHHPDRDPDNPQAEERFKDISNAYDILSDAKKKARFDAGEIDINGNAFHKRPPPRYRSKQRSKAKHSKKKSFEDFFRENTARKRERIKVNGANISYTLSVDFLEAALGARRRISMTNGKRLNVVIPPGTQDGQVLRLKEQGMDGIGGGQSGDAHVEISITPHPLFSSDGDDVRTDLPITLQEAVLGGKAQVQTIDGPVALTIPPNSNTGSVLRLKEKGLEKQKGKGRGDQYVHLNVVLPKKRDKDFVDFVKKWGSENAYRVRKETEDISD
jgi:DnaJ-class molecular chaperone